jgi:UDP-GlcNAc3NAcA epimerase
LRPVRIWTSECRVLGADHRVSSNVLRFQKQTKVGLHTHEWGDNLFELAKKVRTHSILKLPMKVLSIVGARPQFIKAAPLSRLLRSANGTTEVLVHTGQHYDENMSEVFFRDLDIPEPEYHLGIGSANQGAQTGRMLEAVEGVLLKEQPEWVLVYGDTNSTLAGALAAVKLHIPVAHVEAGLRSFNQHMPEEINRVLTDHCASLLFTPTEAAVKNLRSESICREWIHLVGDVMYDVALHYAQKAEQVSSVLQRLGVKPKAYLLATVHRAENTDDPIRLEAIFRALREVSEDLPVVLPLHPRTRGALNRLGLGTNWGGVKVVDPVSYLEMVALEKDARIVATDSGGVQKEAFFYGVPCVTLRTETEWVELVELGWNRLAAPTSPQAVLDGIRAALDSRGQEAAPYGQGDAARRIVAILLQQSGR